MRKCTLSALVVLALSIPAHAQDDLLRVMVSKAAAIVHVEVAEVTGGMIEEVGVENWFAVCRAIETIKGDIKTNGTFRIDCSRLVTGEKEALRFEKGRRYVVFLGPGKQEPYFLLDHWVPPLPASIHLLKEIRRLADETDKVQQRAAPLPSAPAGPSERAR
jgi:hypothetical protein